MIVPCTVAEGRQGVGLLEELDQRESDKSADLLCHKGCFRLSRIIREMSILLAWHMEYIGA